MSGERLLVVEDEVHLAEVIADNLEHEGWSVGVVGDGLVALEHIRAERPDLVLLDVMLPGMDGFEVCRKLRAEGNDVPILFLTAKSSRDDRVRGLQLGGDDYLGKPFDLEELILRVHAILRRAEWFREPSPAGEELKLGEAVVDFKTYTVRIDSRTVELSQKETMILRCLARRIPDAAHGRQLHRAPASPARARPAQPPVHPHRARHRLPPDALNPETTRHDEPPSRTRRPSNHEPL
jgi:two-component system OmpR family response regulator